MNNLNTKHFYTNELNRQKLQVATKPWLITYCLALKDDDEVHSEDEEEEEANYELNCLDDLVKLKIAISLDGLVNVGSIDCDEKTTDKEICEKLRPSKLSPILYYPSLPGLDEDNAEVEGKPITTSDYKEISQIILKSLPDESELNEQELEQVLAKLRDPNMFQKTWLIQFVNQYEAGEDDLELKKLPVLFGPGN